MQIDFTPAQKELRSGLRTYLAQLVTPEVLAESAGGAEGGGPQYTRVLKQLAADGWLGIGWPKEYGGQARPPIEQYIFFDEVQRAGFPIPFLTLNTVGPTLMKYGTDEQKQRFLPAILRGEVHFAIGYTEPEAGTDLASLKTRAVRDGDDYLVNGQKAFTSLADHADFVWLAVRTAPDEAKHAGISILMVDMKAPGVSMTPIWTLGGTRTNATYFDNVRVPVSMRVGAENQGWKLITTQLNHERVALSAPAMCARLYEETLAWAKSSGTASKEWVRRNLALAHAKLEVLRLLGWRQASNLERGLLDPAESSAIKVFSSESFVEIYKLLLEVIGATGTLTAGSPGVLLRGKLEHFYRTTLVFTFGGGVNEVQRDIIAVAGLRLPRPPR